MPDYDDFEDREEDWQEGPSKTEVKRQMTELQKLGEKLCALGEKELAKIHAATSQKGQTCVCTQLHWKGHLVKASISLAVGKKSHDKRDAQKERDWNRQKQRIVRENVKQ